jgi:hypothetical protein
VHELTTKLLVRRRAPDAGHSALHHCNQTEQHILKMSRVV